MTMVEIGTAGSKGEDPNVFVYIVQRSGYAGLQQSQPPVDYRRLLMSRNEADQVAYGSAHHFSNGSPVRTIQLPDGSFGFLSGNYLFWVRKVSATATTSAPTSNAALQQQKFVEAHCVLSDGLLGGTSKRRNVLVAEKHSIFIGPHSSHSALQFLMHSPLADKGGATVQWVPVGPPPSLAQLAQEWPLGENNQCGMAMESARSNNNKRSGDEGDSFVWFHPQNRHRVDDVNMKETARSTKRACWSTQSPSRRSHTAEAMVIE